MDNNLDYSFEPKVLSTGRKLQLWPLVLFNKDGKLQLKKIDEWMQTWWINIFTFFEWSQGFSRSSLATTDP